MIKERLLLVISDFHLGVGPTLSDGRTNDLEDFFHDSTFVEFLDHYSTGPYARRAVELCINGDFFNYLQVLPGERWPKPLTEASALSLTEAIMDGHWPVFDALTRFAAAPHHAVTFLIGNHDLGLFWPSVRGRLVKLLGTTVRVHPQPVHCPEGVWIEHGSQYLPENRLNFENPIVQSEDGLCIDMPWGYPSMIRFLNLAKQRRSYINRVRPFRLYLRWALRHDTFFLLKAGALVLSQVARVLVRRGATGKRGRRELLRFIRESSAQPRLDRAAKRIFALHPEIRIVVFGHGHRAAARSFPGGRQYFNSGLWNETIDLDRERPVRQARLHYIEITKTRRGQPMGRLLEWSGTN